MPFRRASWPFLAAFVVTAFFYAWTATSDGLGWGFGRPQSDYYNLLVSGFLKGQLSLDTPVPEALLRSPDPYDPAVRPSGTLHDTSYYRGRYYIYYGPVPAVVLLLPFRLLTGTALPLMPAVLFFACLGLALALLLLAEARRRFFPRGGPWATFFVAVAFGFATCVPFLLRRHSLYELPIASGFAFSMAALYCAFRAMASEGRRVAWIAVSSLGWGLAVGCRPTFLLAPLGALAGLAFMWRAERKPGGQRLPWGALVAAIVPIGCIGALLGLYNFLRFGSFSEFGVSYILSGVYEAKIDHFRLRYLPWNVVAYFFSFGEWGRYFPFYHAPAIALPLPRQHFGMDFAFGLLVHVPSVWCAAGVWRAGAAVEVSARPLWRALVVTVAWLMISVWGFVLCFYAAMTRYLGDLAPGLALLAAFGAMAWLDRAARNSRPRVRGLTSVAVCAGAAVSAFTVFAGSAKIYDIFRFNPTGYARTARVFNAPVHVVERLAGSSPGGALRLKLQLPATLPAGGREDLVVTGWRGETDAVFVTYPDPTHVQIGFEHQGSPPQLSAPIAVDRAVAHEVRVALGSLLPPASHPLFAMWPEGGRIAAQRQARVEFDGTPVLDLYQRFHPASPGSTRIGDTGARAFSGKLLEIGREPLAGPPSAAAVTCDGERISRDGVMRLKVRFAPPAQPAREPLVVSGETGRGDFVVVEYLADGRLRFLLDHWGRVPYVSEPIACDLTREHLLEIEFSAYLLERARDIPSGQGRLALKLDGRLVWECAARFYQIEACDVFIGRNLIGGSACGERFTGSIVPVEPAAAEASRR